MKHEKKVTVLLLTLFLIHQLFALTVFNQADNYLETEYSNEEISSQSIILPIFIIIFSVIILLLYKFKKILIVWYYLAFITCISLTLSFFINYIYAIIIAIILLIIKKSNKDNYFNNTVELLIYPGAVITLIPSLNLLSTIILLILISIYDFFSVNITKHMIKLAKNQMNENIFSGIKITYNKKSAILGGGDIAFLMILSGVIFRDFGVIHSIITIIFSTLALAILLLKSDKKKFYPAMPFITAGAMIGIILSNLLVI